MLCAGRGSKVPPATGTVNRLQQSGLMKKSHDWQGLGPPGPGKVFFPELLAYGPVSLIC
jgi:hypothetical protein